MLEELYQPNDQNLYNIGLGDLKHIHTALERRVVNRRLVMRNDKPSLLMNKHARPLMTGERWKTTVKYIWPNIVHNIYRGMSQTTGENRPNNNRRNDDV